MSTQSVSSPPPSVRRLFSQSPRRSSRGIPAVFGQTKTLRCVERSGWSRREIRLLVIGNCDKRCHCVSELVGESCAEPLGANIEFRIFAARRMHDAQEVLRREVVDVALLDLSLSDEEWSEILRAIRDFTARVPLIVLAPADDGKSARDAFSEGAADYLVQDRLDRTLLLRSILYVLERKRAELERLELESQFRTAYELQKLGMMASGVAHDLANSLQGILAQTSHARIRAGRDTPAEAQLIQIEELALQATELVNTLFTSHRTLDHPIEHISLSGVARETLALLKPMLPVGVVLTYDLSRELPTIVASTSEIRRVLSNLLTNAVESLPNGVGEIYVRTGVQFVSLGEWRSDEQGFGGCSVFIEVSDSGVGMDSATQERIFDPFFTTKPSGRGLGLASVRSIILGYGGSITVRSEPGTGTTFRVSFPASSRVLAQVEVKQREDRRNYEKNREEHSEHKRAEKC